MNEVIPPQDGDGLYIIMGQCGGSEAAMPDGVHMVTFEFEALGSGIAEVGLSHHGPGSEDQTIVWDGVTPNLVVTGDLTSGSVAIGAASSATCPMDFSGDGEIGMADMITIFANWQDPYTSDHLLGVLTNWGPCGN
jgi:hypothetical protein